MRSALTSVMGLLLLLLPGVAAEGQESAPGGELFPGEPLMRPLVANPREPGFHLSLLSASSPRDLDALIGVAEQGGTFGLARWTRGAGRTAVQLDVTGSVAAQFDLSTTHWDMLNADFTFGFPLTVRRGATAARLRLYHLSSHLGDEFVRRDSVWVWGDPPPVPDGFRAYHQSYRFESVQLLVQRELGDWRVYGGGDYFLYVAPAQLDRRMLVAGIELSRPLGRREARSGAGSGWSYLAALDVTALEYREWEPAWSFRSGFEVSGARSGPRAGGRRAGVLMELHSGPAPYGQFATHTTVRYVGGGFFLTL